MPESLSILLVMVSHVLLAHIVGSFAADSSESELVSWLVFGCSFINAVMALVGDIKVHDCVCLFYFLFYCLNAAMALVGDIKMCVCVFVCVCVWQSQVACELALLPSLSPPSPRPSSSALGPLPTSLPPLPHRAFCVFRQDPRMEELIATLMTLNCKNESKLNPRHRARGLKSSLLLS